MQRRLEIEMAEMEFKDKKDREEDYDNAIGFLREKKFRKWVCHRGKSDILDFSDEQISKLQECFGALDDDGSGSIGIDELEEPLIGLGFADTREDVIKMIMDVDDDKSGMIEFEEFLEIIKNSDGNEQTAKINRFFKSMSGGKKEFKDTGKSFGLIVQDKKR